MEDRFVGKNIDLQLFTERLILFFEQKDFGVFKSKMDDGWGLVVISPPRAKIVDKIAVFVTGHSRDFSVKFTAGSRSRTYKWLGHITTFFGGGVLFSKGFESELALERLEREFWVYVDETVATISDL